ncbi:hypothetical protein SLEP1_g53125 [Rubroshorea leprosula]|uniref:Uncharacterized protein n=1 Tax=Rubroshorea leprosula TaxID=152421 RepID=A0AAV5MBY0_9ROSI|nr:hypothetical protein SLEP1_g53125 [Rubroshorea leprosula]
MKKLRQRALIIMRESWKMLLIGSLTPEVLELSKQIKEKLKEADQYGIIF